MDLNTSNERSLIAENRSKKIFFGHNLAILYPKQENFNDLLFNFQGTLLRFKKLRKISKMGKFGPKTGFLS